MAQAVIGLGNPGGEYHDTRHNIGHRVIDCLAARFSLRRSREVVSVEWKGETLYLLKPSSFMNVTGPAVARLLRRLALTPADVIIVYDDIDLTLGKVRLRLKGSHGGHNGMRSIMETLGTSELRRVKVGIGRPALKGKVVEHVLTRFSRDELPLVEAACDEAADAALKLVTASQRDQR